MMKSVVILSAMASVAVAQTSTPNPLIPKGISDSCTTFLTSLNSDTTLASCITPIIDASSQFAPGSDTSASPSASTINSALNNLCSTSATGACSDATVRGKLADFYTACTSEITGENPNADVRRTYDVLYVLTPFKQAVCSKDESGQYCVTQVHAPADSNGGKAAAGSPSPAPALTLIDNNLVSTIGSQIQKRAKAVQNATSALVPNTTTYRETNLVFLLLDPSLPKDQLCTTCTKNVLTSYINFEESVPYAPGLSASPLMGGQTDLYNGVKNVCGDGFMGGAVQAAGGLGGGVLGNGNGNGASKVAGGDFAGAGAMVAAVAVALAALL